MSSDNNDNNDNNDDDGTTTKEEASPEDDVKFGKRLRNALATVQAWDDDPLLLRECRCLLPWDDLTDKSGTSSPYARPTDDVWLGSANARFVQRLARYFQSSMTWMNQPACASCDNSRMTFEKIRGPETVEEREGQAHRVEVYHCSSCGNHTVFPRYNAVRKLLTTRTGRCGEYANLFGLTCRSVGLETRYVSDWTDHVWVEVYLVDYAAWVMVDACEGVVNEPSMYEAGWGKKLNYIVAVAPDHVVDVTPRYSRQWVSSSSSPETILSRRRKITSSEAAGAQQIAALQQQLAATTPVKARTELDRRLQRERRQLESEKTSTQWPKRAYRQGRISGSLAWKTAREETGRNQAESEAESEAESATTANGTNTTNATTAQCDPSSAGMTFAVESWASAGSVPVLWAEENPTTVRLQIVAQPLDVRSGILVCGTPCAASAGQFDLSVVVVDESLEYCGTLLQSRAFDTLAALADFVDTIPRQRIVLLRGTIAAAAATTNETEKANLARLRARLGGLDTSLLSQTMCYIGQVEANPSWTVCRAIEDVCIAAPLSALNAASSARKFQRYRRTQASTVVGCLPEKYMPLEQQKTASLREQRKAVQAYQNDQKSDAPTITGYSSKQGTPIYLLGPNAFPLLQQQQQEEEDENGSSSTPADWITEVLLPEPIVVEEEEEDESEQPENDDAPPSYQVPVDLGFFTSQLGPQLMTSDGSTKPIGEVLDNVRLVALYFSAHWCGPCRSFTPMLAEAYQVWKENDEPGKPRGIEIVFCSSDRDGASFANYYRGMPWTALSWDTLSIYKPQLSMIYGIQGIPSLVVLDAVSGEVVVKASASRRELGGAARGGEYSLLQLRENWFSRVPAATLELLNMLELSCTDSQIPTVLNEGKDSATVDRFATLQKYLVRSPTDTPTSAEPMEKGPLDSTYQSSPTLSFSEARKRCEAVCLQLVLDVAGQDGLVTLLETALKYVANARESPWKVKFRSFKLSNKVAYRMATIPFGLLFLQAMGGWEVVATEPDFCLCISLQADLDAMHDELQAYLEKYKV